MSGYDYPADDYDSYSLESDLDRIGALWRAVYDRIDQAVADIEAGRPTLGDDEAKTTEEYQHDNELREERELSILREYAHEIVQAALVALRP